MYEPVSFSTDTSLRTDRTDRPGQSGVCTTLVDVR